MIYFGPGKATSREVICAKLGKIAGRKTVAVLEQWTRSLTESFFSLQPSSGSLSTCMGWPHNFTPKSGPILRVKRGGINNYTEIAAETVLSKWGVIATLTMQKVKSKMTFLFNPHPRTLFRERARERD